jgi:hypothetical protein
VKKVTGKDKYREKADWERKAGLMPHKNMVGEVLWVTDPWATNPFKSSKEESDIYFNSNCQGGKSTLNIWETDPRVLRLNGLSGWCRHSNSSRYMRLTLNLMSTLSFLSPLLQIAQPGLWTHYVAQIGFKLLPQTPKYWDYMWVLPRLAYSAFNAMPFPTRW